MGQEIERKFRVEGDGWRGQGTGTALRQGYLSAAKDCSVRVRVAGEKGFLTVKGESRGAVRAEFEYEIPLADAHEMLDRLCRRPLIEKTRYRLPAGALTWEIDEFSGENAGLIVAEIELEHEDQPFERPAWLGEEVTDDPRYLNTNLVARPYRTWKNV